MKIIAGALKGMKLIAPKEDLITRPTSAKVREAILHKLTSDVQEAIFIDFFSGTGAIGLEAISRGASGSYFIEKDPSVVKLLKKNIELASQRLGKQEIYPKTLQVFCLPAARAFRSLNLEAHGKTPIVLWADPPYKDFLLWLKVLQAELNSLPSSLILIVMELSVEYLKHPDFILNSWNKDFEKVYGSTAVVGFRKNI